MHALVLVAALYWESGVRGATPTVCFAGTGGTARADRIAQIKEVLKQFEYAANIRFDLQSELHEPAAGERQRLLARRHPRRGSGHGWKSLRQVQAGAGQGMPDSDPGLGGGWSNSPAEFAANRPCVFNMHLGNDSFTTCGLRRSIRRRDRRSSTIRFTSSVMPSVCRTSTSAWTSARIRC